MSVLQKLIKISKFYWGGTILKPWTTKIRSSRNNLSLKDYIQSLIQRFIQKYVYLYSDCLLAASWLLVSEMNASGGMYVGYKSPFKIETSHSSIALNLDESLPNDFMSATQSAWQLLRAIFLSPLRIWLEMAISLKTNHLKF